MITELTRSVMRELSAKMELALQKADLGVTVTYRGSRFDSRRATLRFEVSVGDTTGQEEAAKNRMADFARIWNLPEDCYGAQIRLFGKTYKLVDININARKYPFVGENMANGKRYRLSGTQVKTAMALAKAGTA